MFECASSTLASVIAQLVEQIEARFADAQREMSDPEIFGDRQRAAAAGRSYRQLEPAAKLAEAWRRAVDDEAGARELLEEEGENAEVREVPRLSRLCINCRPAVPKAMKNTPMRSTSRTPSPCNWSTVIRAMAMRIPSAITEAGA